MTAGAPAAAQMHAPAGARPLRALVPPPPRLALRQPAASPAPSRRLVAGGVLGGVLGFLAGGAAGLAAGSARDCGDDDFCALRWGAIGATAGTSVGIPVGTYVAGGRRGPLATSAALSLALGAAGVAGMDATHYDAPWAPIILAATPVAQLAVSVGLERRRAR